MSDSISIGAAYRDQKIVGGSVDDSPIGATTASTGVFSTLNVTTPSIGGTAVLATAAELNRVADSSTRVVATTATAISVTATVHGSKVVLVNASSACAVSLPVAAATGEIYTFVLGVAATATAHTIAANGTDIIQGVSLFS